MTHSERQAFKNYFWTAQLIAGPTMAIKVFELSLAGVAASVAGFLFAAPIAALFVYIKIVADRHFPPDPVPKTRWKFVAIMAAIGVVILLGALALHYG